MTQTPGGSLKYADSTKFNVSTQIAVGEVHVAPGAMRELHVSRLRWEVAGLLTQWDATIVAPDPGRMGLLHRGTGSRDYLRLVQQRRHFQLPGRRRQLRPRYVWYVRELRASVMPDSALGHYVENTGNTTLRFLEIWNSGTVGYLYRR